MRDVIKDVIAKHKRGDIQGNCPLYIAIENALVKAGYGKRKPDWEVKKKGDRTKGWEA